MSDWITIAGVVVTVGALIVTIRAGKKASVVSTKQLAIEEQRDSERRQAARQAQLVPAIRHVGTNYKLFVRNDGMAAARDIVVMLDGEPFERHCCAIPNHEISTSIGSRGEVSCMLLLSLECAAPKQVRLTWNDASQIPGVYEGGISI